MARFVLINVHTERLADDEVWKRAEKFARLLARKKQKAIWFALNPLFVAPNLSSDDKRKWQERLRVIVGSGQIISQHSHFYKSFQNKRQGKDYDLSLANVSERIIQDKKWLEGQGFKVKGFLSGAWQMNSDILSILKEQGFKYDVSLNNLQAKKGIGVERVEGILRIPATATVKRMFADLIILCLKRRFFKTEKGLVCALHLHDYDLKNNLNIILLRILMFLFPLIGFRVIDIETFYEIR